LKRGESCLELNWRACRITHAFVFPGATETYAYYYGYYASHDSYVDSAQTGSAYAFYSYFYGYYAWVYSYYTAAGY
jgi:hypothetical protein